jgi:hypothetical protein
MGAGFLLPLHFPQSIFIPPTAPHSLIILSSMPYSLVKEGLHFALSLISNIYKLVRFNISILSTGSTLLALIPVWRRVRIPPL